MPLDDPRSAPTPSPVGCEPANDEETKALLAAVAAFAAHEIMPRRSRPEQPLSIADFTEIAQAANAAGLLDNGADGFGLWSDFNERLSGLQRSTPHYTLSALQIIAAADAAVAWQLHGRALGRIALRMIALRTAGLRTTAPQSDATEACVDAFLALDGTHGIGRSAFGRWLAGHTLHDSDHALLADVYGERPRSLLLTPDTKEIALMRWDPDTACLQLAMHALSTENGFPLRHEDDGKPHGLDGCQSIRIAAKDAVVRGSLQQQDVASLFAAQQLAQVAIARGALTPIAKLAHDYAVLRKQGARIIAMHDAVALLLADIDTACAIVDALLRDAGAQPLSPQRAVALRREAMPLLMRAANAAMQVHGGVGYMRDSGVEHVLRAINTLRLLNGSPTELGLVAAGFSANASATLAALPENDRVAHLGDHLPGHLPAFHPLSPLAAFRRVPLLRLLANHDTQNPRNNDPWEIDTRSLPRALAQLRRRTRAFAERECAPLAARIDREQHDAHAFFPALQTLVKSAGKAGLLTDLLPAPLGSAPIPQFAHSLALQQAIRVEELARVDGGLMLLLSAHALGICPLLLSGDIHLLRRVLLPAFRATENGNPQVFAFAITEPSAGSDAEEGHGAQHQSPGVRATRGEKNGERGWFLRGRKVFISGGDIARYVSVFAALDGEGFESWTCFLVDTRSPGFRVARCEMKMGMRASGAAELEFDNCFVADDCVVGGLRNGWALARATLNLSRLPVAAMAVGFAQQAIDIATQFACAETLAGRPLLHYRHVQATLADLQAETGAIRQLVWHHARGWRPRQDGAALCKFHATDRAQVVVETAMDLLGNAAIRHDARIERTFRDVRLTRIFEGTNQINRLAVIEDQQALLLDNIAKRKSAGIA